MLWHVYTNTGDLLSEETKDILVELRLPATSTMGELKSGDFKIGVLKVSYFDVASASMQTTLIELVVHRAELVPVSTCMYMVHTHTHTLNAYGVCCASPSSRRYIHMCTHICIHMYIYTMIYIYIGRYGGDYASIPLVCIDI